MNLGGSNNPVRPVAVVEPVKGRLREGSAIIWAFVAPASLTVIGVVVFPLLYSLYLSMEKYELTDPGNVRFIGLGNYLTLLKSQTFWDVMGRTGTFTLISVAITMIIGLLFAMILNLRFKGRGVMRALLLIPWVMPAVVVGISWEWIFNANYGILNAILMQLGLLSTIQPWLGDPTTAMPAVLVAKVWKEIPFTALIFLAGLQTIPADLYEVSRIDGAGAWQAFLHITLPLLRPVALVVIVIETMWTFRIFDLIFVMTNGGPMDTTNLAAFYTYLVTFKYLHVGLGSALAYMVTGIIVAASLLYIRLVGSTVEY
jgi:multiple sugar transport system permease protein